MGTEEALYRRWINELWAGKPVAAELVSDDFVGHWPDRDVHGPGELQAIVDGRYVEYWTGTSTG